MEIVRDFKDIRKENVSIAGGKGASLGEMTQVGISIPEGFVILSEAFENFIRESDLNVEIDAVLDTVKHEEIHSVEEASEKIQALILNVEMSKEIETKIFEFFDKLGATFVAVRSSATSEDGAEAAWAGQLDTFLNVRKDKLIESVKKCWASLFTPRAIFYRFEKGFHGTDISVAVVVQKMINSEESGIAFSVHPVTEDPNQIIIEAGFGLGEAIVSGQITPDSYVVDKQDWHIIDINVNEQSKGLFRKEDGGNLWKELGEDGKKQVLSEEEIIKLSKLVVKIENHYDFPVDIEWAKEKGKFYITQSRPITTLTSLEKEEEENLAQKFIDSLGGQEFNSSTDVDIFPETVVWIKRDFIKENYDNKDILPSLFLMQEDESIEYSPEKKFVEVSKELFKKYMQDERSLSKIERIFQKDLENISKMYEKYTYNQINKLPLNHLQEIIPGILKSMEPKLFFMCEFEICKDYIQTLKLNQAENLWEVAKEVPVESFDTRKQRVFYEKLLQLKKKDLIEFCQYFYTGLKGVTNINKIEKKLIKEFEFDKKKAEAKKKKLDEGFKKIQARKKEKLLSLTENEKKIVNYIVKLSEMRDIRKDIHTKGITILYRIAKLKILDKVKIPEKYLEFISYDELLKDINYFKENKRDILKRKKGYALLVDDSGNTFSQYGDIKSLKKILNKQMNSQNKSKNNLIKGNCAYPGKIKGRVRVIDNIRKQANEFCKGEILVTSMTRSEFVPLMKKSIATITNEGGITCHAAIISRELKIPCIIGTKNATEILRDGDLVEVDADNGVVKILDIQKKVIVKGENIISKLESGNWQIDWDADLSHLAISLTCNAYFKRSQKLFSTSMKSFFTTLKKGKVVAYLEVDDLERFSADLVEKVSTPKLAEDWAKNFKNIADVITEAVKASNPEDFLKQLDYYADLFDEYGAWQIATKAVYSVLPSSLDKKIPLILEDARKYSEKFYKELGIFQKIGEHLAKKESKYTSEMLTTITAEELQEYLRTDVLPAPEILNARWECSGMYINKEGKTTHLSCEQVRDIEQSWVEELSGNKIKGTSAYKGKVVGTCKLIEDFKGASLNKGDILVTVMTDPNFVPLMKKAAAIITDGGGMLCHAAIVSRELRKPCIIGTKIATKVLKDGMEVEVDADKGIIKILSNESIKGPRINPDNYVQMFRGEAQEYFLISDIILEHFYKKLEVLVTCKNGHTWTTYLPKEIEKKTLKEGLKLFRSKDSFEKYWNDFEKHKEESKEFFENILKKNKVSKKEVKEFFNLMGNFWRYYSKTEFFFVDDATRLMKNKVVNKNLNQLEKIKNEGREFMNELLFVDKSYFRRFINLLGKQFNKSFHRLAYYTLKEILDLFESKEVDSLVLDRRSKNYVMISNKNSINILVSDDAEDIINIFDENEETKIKKGILEGVVANKGKVRGKAFVSPTNVRELFDNITNLSKQMTKGDILVAETTSPEIMPLCKKASAIVTNQGGLLSHAAIISRELNIPCIVGTERATDLFNTGDFIEVDASKGVVRIISKNKGIHLEEKELLFEFEYQREAPILMFYIWNLGHIGAYELLDMDPNIAKKVFGTYEKRIFKAFTQRDNLNKMKFAIKKKNEKDLENIIKNYLLDYELLKKSNELVFDKDFISKIVAGFVVTFILGDISEYTLQKKALNARVKTEELFYNLLKNLKKISGVKDIEHYSYDELINKTKVNKKELNSRKIALLLFDKIISLKKDEDYRDIVAKNGIKLKKKRTKIGKVVEMKGFSASPGIVKGKVKIIRYKNKISSMKEGEILVTEMTSPEFVPAMKKAAAIITDEGGITSHAAIVSRELKKPCVIGTKIATQVLKDGDLVEVDADKGIVRIIERN